ncbi:MAG TPA: CcdB family protein [Gammaproteobacteria bacterium]|nr:CcdB family protein [Gammaproteobacteria bacterium]
MPLRPATRMTGKGIKVLTPVFAIAGKQYVMLTPQLAGVPRRALGEQVGNLTSSRDRIIAALDLLITGI